MLAKNDKRFNVLNILMFYLDFLMLQGSTVLQLSIYLCQLQLEVVQAMYKQKREDREEQSTKNVATM